MQKRILFLSKIEVFYSFALKIYMLRLYSPVWISNILFCFFGVFYETFYGRISIPEPLAHNLP